MPGWWLAKKTDFLAARVLFKGPLKVAYSAKGFRRKVSPEMLKTYFFRNILSIILNENTQ